MMPKCEPYLSGVDSETIRPPFVKQEKSIKQKEQIELYNALFEVHKKAMEIDRIVSDLAAKKVLEEASLREPTPSAVHTQPMAGGKRHEVAERKASSRD